MGIQKVGRFINASIDHAAKGFKIVSAEEYNSRLTTCMNCENYNMEDVDNPTCKICECKLKIKASWAEQECPIKKWLASIPTKKVGSFTNINNTDGSNTQTHIESYVDRTIIVNIGGGCGGCGG